MARQPRIEFPDAVYHIMARGNEKKKIFYDMNDYKKFIDILQEIKIKYSIKLYAYTLMPNHYHLLLKTCNPNLSQAMHFLQTKYTVYFNRKRNHVGHLFQGRYKAIVVDNDEYLVEVSRYIHLNPVKAGITDKIEKYQWTSFNEYMKGISIIVDIDEILYRFSKRTSVAIKNYKFFCYDGVDKDLKGEIESKIYAGVILGDKKFGDKVKDYIKQEKINNEIKYKRKLVKRISKKSIEEAIIMQYNVERNKLFIKGRKERDILIYLLKKYTDMRLIDIANYIGGVHYSSVTKIANKIKNDKRLLFDIESIERIFL